MINDEEVSIKARDGRKSGRSSSCLSILSLVMTSTYHADGSRSSICDVLRCKDDKQTSSRLQATTRLGTYTTYQLDLSEAKSGARSNNRMNNECGEARGSKGKCTARDFDERLTRRMEPARGAISPSSPGPGKRDHSEENIALMYCITHYQYYNTPLRFGSGSSFSLRRALLYFNLI